MGLRTCHETTFSKNVEGISLKFMGTPPCKRLFSALSQASPFRQFCTASTNSLALKGRERNLELFGDAVADALDSGAPMNRIFRSTLLCRSSSAKSLPEVPSDNKASAINRSGFVLLACQNISAVDGQ